MLFPPNIGDPAALIEELPDDDNIVPQDALGHPHPVDLDVQGEVLPSSDRVPMDGPIVGDDEGHINTWTTFFSRVSLVVHSRFLSSFSLKASFILSVDVTFTTKTTFPTGLRSLT